MDFRTKLEIYKNERERRPNSVGLLIEGDSWFDLPFIFQGTNLVMSLKEALGDKIAILKLSHSGDEARGMLSGDQFKTLQETLNTKGCSFDAILFSGGGNDLVGPNLLPLLNAFVDDRTAENCINPDRVRVRLSQIANAYEELTWLRDDYEPNAVIFTHGYDFAKPTGEGARFILEFAGGWIKARLDSKGIPERLHHEIVTILLKAFDKQIRETMGSKANCVHVQTQGTLDPNSHWGDELHPNKEGFDLLARKFIDALKAKFPNKI